MMGMEAYTFNSNILNRGNTQGKSRTVWVADTLPCVIHSHLDVLSLTPETLFTCLNMPF